MPRKYEPLRNYLNGEIAPTVTLTFRQIEKILGSALPDSARLYAAWWANGGHAYSSAWTSVDRKARPDLTAQTVQFSTPRRGTSASKPRGSERDVKVAAEVWVAARILYVPLYLIQIPFARSLVWFVSIFALVAMLVRLFQ